MKVVCFAKQKVKSSKILLLFYNVLKNPYGTRPFQRAFFFLTSYFLEHFVQREDFADEVSDFELLDCAFTFSGIDSLTPLFDFLFTVFTSFKGIMCKKIAEYTQRTFDI